MSEEAEIYHSLLAAPFYNYLVSPIIDKVLGERVLFSPLGCIPCLCHAFCDAWPSGIVLSAFGWGKWLLQSCTSELDNPADWKPSVSYQPADDAPWCLNVSSYLQVLVDIKLATWDAVTVLSNQIGFCNFLRLKMGSKGSPKSLHNPQCPRRLTR